MPLTPLHLAQVYYHAPNLWPIAAAAAIGAAALVLALYPGQIRRLRWPWRGIVPGLRIAAGLILAASMLKPSARRLATPEERGSVLILVDRSRSMSVVDNSRTPAELVALADGLGKLPKDVRGDRSGPLAGALERLRGLAAQVRTAQDDLEYARVSGRDIQMRQTRAAEAIEAYSAAAKELIDSAATLVGGEELVSGLRSLLQAPNSAAREAWRTALPHQIDQAAQLVVQYQNTSDDRLYDSNPDVRAACDAVAMQSRYALVESAILGPSGVAAQARKDAGVVALGIGVDLTPLSISRDHFDVAPDEDQSDLTGAIARAVAREPVRAVVLFSDGRQVGGDEVVTGLTPSGVPIFAVNAAAPDPPRDISFGSVTLPGSIFAGQSMKVRAELRHGGFDSEVVELHCEVGAEVQTKKITLRAGKPAQAEFGFKLPKAGAQRVRLWFPPIHGEASTENNQVERWVKVVPERMRVMLIASAPTWDFRAVRSALSGLTEVQLKDYVLDPSNPHLSLPLGEIASQDVIVLFDVPEAALDDRRWDAVERVVRASGASVILAAGQSHLPAEYARLASTASLLPFNSSYRPVWNVSPLEEPTYRFDATPEGESLDFLHLGREADAAEADAPPRRWEQLPAFFRFLQLPDPHDEKNWKQQVHPLLVEEESRLPVLTEMPLGAGRVFFVGFDETWRWRYKVGDRDQEHFWRQMIQYASEDPYSAHDGPLALDTDKVAAEPGQAVHVRARITEESAEAQPTYVLDVLKEGKLASQMPLSPVGAAHSGRFSAVLTLSAGDYTIRWQVHGASKRVNTVMLPLHVASTSESELANLAGDPDLLHKLAEASGGEYLPLDQASRLGERLSAAGDAQTRYAELRLWDSPWLFLSVIGCLGAEWALRKRFGLA